MTYRLDYTDEAKSHLAKLAKDETEVVVLVLAAYGHYEDK